MLATLSEAEFTRVIADPVAIEELAADRPAAVVEVDPNPSALKALADRTIPLIVIARAAPEPAVGAPAWCDVFVDSTSDSTVDLIAATVERCPQAAVALALLLRHFGATDTSAGLIAESSTYSALQAGPEFARWRARDSTPRATDDDRERVMVARDGDRLDVTMVRPERANAIDVAMRDALVAAFRLAVVDESITEVHLRGEGPSFCTGGDLGDFGRFSDPVDSHLVRLLRSPAALAARLGPRLVSHVHGSCVGGGMELAAFSHRVRGRSDTVVSLPEVGLGLIPGAGGTVSIPRRIGRHRTARLALTGEVIDASTALRWGLIDEITD